MGVLIIMVTQMARDMKIWLTLVVIFMIAFSVTFAAMSEHDESFIDSLLTPAWAMFGELGNIPDHASGKTVLSLGLAWLDLT